MQRNIKYSLKYYLAIENLIYFYKGHMGKWKLRADK